MLWSNHIGPYTWYTVLGLPAWPLTLTIESASTMFDALPRLAFYAKRQAHDVLLYDRCRPGRL